MIEMTLKDQEILGRIFAFNKLNLTPLHQVTSLNDGSTFQEWDTAFSNQNSRILIVVIELLKQIPKPDDKEIRKLKDIYNDLITICLKVGHIYSKSYDERKLKRSSYAQMLGWCDAARNLREKYISQLNKISKKYNEL